MGSLREVSRIWRHVLTLTSPLTFTEACGSVKFQGTLGISGLMLLSPQDDSHGETSDHMGPKNARTNRRNIDFPRSPGFWVYLPERVLGWQAFDQACSGGLTESCWVIVDRGKDFCASFDSLSWGLNHPSSQFEQVLRNLLNRKWAMSHSPRSHSVLEFGGLIYKSQTSWPRIRFPVIVLICCYQSKYLKSWIATMETTGDRLIGSESNHRWGLSECTLVILKTNSVYRIPVCSLTWPK